MKDTTNEGLRILREKTQQNPWTDEREDNLQSQGFYSMPSKTEDYRWVYRNGNPNGRLLVVFCLEELL